MLLTRKGTSCYRNAFTLVELMVAAALAVTIMWILAESFKRGIDFARAAHSTGDMMTQLNNAGQVMMRDLQANHFLPPVSSTTINNNSGKLSSLPLDTLGSSGSGVAQLANAGPYVPPNGYFQIYSPPAASTVTDNVNAFLINTVTNTSLSFTVYLPQGLPQNQFTVTSPPNGQTYTSQAAEISYFLGSPTGGAAIAATNITGYTTPAQGLTPQPLYNLYRRQRLVAVTNNDVQALQPPTNPQSPFYDPNFTDVISTTRLATRPQPTTQINTLASFGTPYTVTNGNVSQMVPALRTVTNPQQPEPLKTAGRVGDDILLSNVLSFEVLAIWNQTPNIVIPSSGLQINSPRPYTVSVNAGNGTFPGNNTYPVSGSPFNSNYPFDSLPLLTFNPNPEYHYVFDTWYAIKQPYPIRNSNPAEFNWNWNNYWLQYQPGRIPDPPGRPIANAPNPNLLPMPVRITALQITIRIYDPKTQQARQNTWRIAM